MNGLLQNHALSNLIFKSRLVFNQAWEDPHIDYKALAITQGDIVLAIASSGDNILNTVLEQPRKIYAIDLNPAQIHLLRLKIASARNLAYEDFWHLFSLAPAPRAQEIYLSTLRANLNVSTRNYWDRNLRWFNRGFYRAGLFGQAIFILRTYLRLTCGSSALENFFKCKTIAQQAELYVKEIHPRWWNPIARQFVAMPCLLMLFGVHPHQVRRIRKTDFSNLLERNIYRTLTTLPAKENYFWQQVFLGRYLYSPPFLRSNNFQKLKSCVGSIDTEVTHLERFLTLLPNGSVSVFNLMDSTDWLTENETSFLWRQILRVATPSARVLFRSIDPNYHVPKEVSIHWEDRCDQKWISEERTGSYSGIYLYVRK